MRLQPRVVEQSSSGHCPTKREVNVYSVESSTRMLEGTFIEFPLFEACYPDHLLRIEDSNNLLYSAEPHPLDYYRVVHERAERVYYQGKDHFIVIHPELKEILERPIKSVYDEGRMESLNKLIRFKETSLDSQKRLAESLDDRLTSFNNLSVRQKIKIALFNKSI